MRKFWILCKGMPRRLKDYWRRRFASNKVERMSRGGQSVNKIITWARNENWRRKEPKK